MEQSINDPWVINPSDLLKPQSNIVSSSNGNNNNDHNHNMIYTPDSNVNFNGFSADPVDNMLSMTYDNTELLDMNYSEVDKFLTDELRDLDIPMIPTTSQDVNASSKCNWNDQLLYETPRYSKKPSMSHKRGASGTAIFGFMNHNKTLSIASFQKNLLNISNSDNDTVPNMHSNEEVVYTKQDELKLVLEKQKELNKRLEDQLRQNQIQQEKLQRALQQQQQQQQQISNPNSNLSSPMKSDYMAVPNISGPSNVSNSNIRTPAKLLQSSDPAENEELLVTSNSVDGRYQFPPPTMLSPPLSSVSNNGSPRHRRSRNFAINSQDLHTTPINQERGNKPQRFSNGNDVVPLIFNHSNNNSSSSASKGSNDNGTTSNNNENSIPEFTQPLNSPFFSFGQDTDLISKNEIKAHKNKESIVSTVSTIPMPADNEYTSSPSRILDMIDMNESLRSPARSKRLSASSTKYQFNRLPTIPAASNENTPVKEQLNPINNNNNNNNNTTTNNNNNIPKKHLFQHNTPIKLPVNNNINNSTNNEHSIHHTPMLSPPKEKIIPSTLICTPTKSPIMRSIPNSTIQEYHPLVPPPPVEPHLGPIKITKKLTTLPPGTIDQYVKELPDKLFECLYPGCSKVFKRRYNVRTHIQTHLKDKPYICDFENCNKSFVRNHDLIRHKKSHAPTNFTCNCGKRFVREEDFKKHESQMLCTSASASTSTSSSPGKKNQEQFSVTKPPRSPQRKNESLMSSSPNAQSPVRASVERDKRGYVASKIEEQLFLHSPEKQEGNHAASFFTQQSMRMLQDMPAGGNPSLARTPTGLLHTPSPLGDLPDLQ